MKQPLNAKKIDDWIKLTKRHKTFWVEAVNDENSDMPPIVFIERDNNVLCSVVCPQVDKILALKAAALLKKSLSPDTITLIVDARMYLGTAGEDVLNKFKPGEMQRMCETENAYERGIISDCLICHRINKDKKIQLVVIPYSYKSKESGIEWKDDTNGFHQTVTNETNSEIIGGQITDALRNIIDMPTFKEDETIADFEITDIRKQM